MDPRPALNWIVDYLEAQDIPYLICGGLAAQAYGGTRPLADIDLYVPDAFIDGIAAMGREYLSFGPAHHRGEQWDLVYLQFSFGDQLVEVGSDRNCRIREASSGEWHSKVLNFTRYQTLPVYGRRVRIMDKADLIAYKRILGRKVDLEDIRQLSEV